LGKGLLDVDQNDSLQRWLCICLPNWDKMHSGQTRHPSEHDHAIMMRHLLWYPIDFVKFSTVLKNHEQAIATLSGHPNTNSFIPFGTKYWA